MLGQPLTEVFYLTAIDYRSSRYKAMGLSFETLYGGIQFNIALPEFVALIQYCNAYKLFQF